MFSSSLLRFRGDGVLTGCSCFKIVDLGNIMSGCAFSGLFQKTPPFLSRLKQSSRVIDIVNGFLLDLLKPIQIESLML